MLTAVLLLAAGCLGSESTNDAAPTTAAGTAVIPADNETDGLPAFQALPEKVSSLRIVANGDAPGGVRLKMWNNRAYVNTGVADDSIAIFDVTDPMLPERVGSIASEVGAREGIDVLNYGDRTVVVVSLASPVAGPIVFWDVTDPAAPVELARLPVQSHIVAAHKPGHVVYNAGFATGPVGGFEIIDATDPDDIKVDRVWEWGEMAQDGTPLQPTGCHDITVQGDRAYCAAQAQTVVIDVSDPFNPVALTAVNDAFVPHHNTAFHILGGRVLVIGDEEGGCGPAAGPATLPAGAAWFYDLEQSPAALLGYVSVPSATPSGGCAPHFGSELGDGTGLVTFGWFGAGLVLIDASDPANPTLVHQDAEGGSASDAVHYRGLVFAAGGAGGLEVAVPE